VIFKDKICLIYDLVGSGLFSIKIKGKSFSLDWMQIDSCAYPSLVVGVFKKIGAPQKLAKPNRTRQNQSFFFSYCPKRFGGCTNCAVCGLYSWRFDFKLNCPRKYKKN